MRSHIKVEKIDSTSVAENVNTYEAFDKERRAQINETKLVFNNSELSLDSLIVEAFACKNLIKNNSNVSMFAE